jgi:hypothetical protein
MSGFLRRFIGAWFALLAVCVGGGGAVHAQTVEAITNPGFEGAFNPVSGEGASGSIADGWQDNSAWYGGSDRIFGSNTDRHGGNTSQYIQLNNDTLVQIRQTLTWTPNENKEYTVEVWLQGANFSQGRIPVDITIAQSQPPYYVMASRIVNVGWGWNKYTLRGMTGSAPAQLIIGFRDPGLLMVDDVKVTSVNAALPALRTGTTIPATWDGMHFNHVWTIPGNNAVGPVGVRRLWNTDYCGWRDVQPTETTWNWGTIDIMVNDAVAKGTRPVYTFGLTPQWASARPNEPAALGDGTAAEPADLQKLAAFATAVAQRYKGKIRHFEIWNECNEGGFFSGTPEKMVEIARTVYDAIKAVDPNNVVLGPNVTTMAGVGYLDYLLWAGVGPYCDVFSVHNYNLVRRTPEAARFLLYNTRKTLEAYGLGAKQIWNTEQGWDKSFDDWGPTGIAPDAVAVAYTARAQLVNWRYGFDASWLYTWDDWGNWCGILFSENNGTNGETPLPAGKAYTNVHAWMVGNRMTAWTTDANGTVRIQITRPNNQKAYVLYNPNQTVNFTLPANWGVTKKWQLDGTRSSLAGANSLSVNGVPVLVEP